MADKALKGFVRFFITFILLSYYFHKNWNYPAHVFD